MGIELVEHAMGECRRVEDGVAPMDHMVVERQNHERRIGDDPADQARIHRKELAGFCLSRIAQTGERIG
jgi:hypothetical protein